jgi:hypothetical protein
LTDRSSAFSIILPAARASFYISPAVHDIAIDKRTKKLYNSIRERKQLSKTGFFDNLAQRENDL